MSSDPQPPTRAGVVVVGAGIIGVSAAAHLCERGHDVVLVDREGVASATSQGNAGCVALSHVAPLASPGMLRRVPGWLLDPLGPLTVAPAYAPRMAPWLIRFCRAASPAAMRTSSRALAAINTLARQESPALMQRCGTAEMMRTGPMMEVYDNAAAHTAAKIWDDLRRTAGAEFEHLHGADAIAAHQPGLSSRFVAATIVHNDLSVSDPRAVTKTIGAYAINRGVTLALADVTSVTPTERGARVVTSAGTIDAGHVVIAAGAWARPLARDLGDRIPLETERGYNTTLPVTAANLNFHLSFAGHGVMVSTLDIGVRVGGAVEPAGLDRPPNYRRADAMLAKAKQFIPALDTTGGTQWMGHRPSLPDSLPVIGPSRATPRVVYAFGHGHLGLTQSAATARIVADMVDGKSPPLDATPFRAGRF